MEDSRPQLIFDGTGAGVLGRAKPQLQDLHGLAAVHIIEAIGSRLWNGP